MKKGLLLLLAVFTVVTLSACKKDDNSLPVFTGIKEVTYDEGSNEPNWLSLVTVTDEEDGDIILDMSNVNTDNVDMDTVGEFEVVYTVEDFDGGVATHTLKVTIKEVVVIVYDVPVVSNKNDIYASVNGIEVSKEEVWIEMVNRYGLNMMLQYIEETIYADYIVAVTDEEIAESKNKLMFGTNDELVIAEIMENDELYNDFIESYNQTLVFQGFNPDNADDVRSYFSLQLAKKAYTEEFLLSSDDEDGFQITDDQLEGFYDELNTPDVCVLTVRFQSSQEQDKVFNLFNLVDNYNYGIGEYYGDIPIDQAASDIFDETNTTQLTDDEVFTKFVLLYNFLNPTSEQLPEDLSKEQYCETYQETAVVNKTEMLELATFSSHPVTKYINLLFNTLRLDTEGYNRYSYRSTNIDGEYVFSYKVSEDTVADFASLDETAKQELKADYAAEMVTSNEVIAAVTREKFMETNLKLIHPIFEMQYEIQNNVEKESFGSLVNVAEYGDMVITADELFDYIDERMGVNTALKLIEKKYLLDSDFYVELYGEDKNFLTTDNALIKGYRDQLDGIIVNFIQGAYLQYGFDPAVMNDQEFLYAGFGEVGEENVILNVFILPNVQFEYAYAALPEYSTYVNYMQKQYDEYFSLITDHLILYLDKNYDFYPDDFSDYIASLNETELTEYNVLKAQFESQVLSELSEGKTYGQIANDFRNSLIGDETSIWNVFKEYGFRMKFENLNTIDQSSVANFDLAFQEGIERLAGFMYRAENSDLTNYHDEQVTTTGFGLHMIKVTKSGSFQKPSAVFAETDPLNPVYSYGSENANVIPTKEQVELYIELLVSDMRERETDVTLPASVQSAVQNGFSEVFDLYVSNWGTNLLSINMLLDGNVTFLTNQEAKTDLLEMQLAIILLQDDFIDVE